MTPDDVAAIRADIERITHDDLQGHLLESLDALEAAWAERDEWYATAIAHGTQADRFRAEVERQQTITRQWMKSWESSQVAHGEAVRALDGHA